MFYYLRPAGVPISWTICAMAAYRKYLPSREGLDAVIEIGRQNTLGEVDVTWEIQENQYPESTMMIVQGMNEHIDEETRTILAAVMKSALTRYGFYIPEDEWKQRYPAQALVRERFRAWNEACNNPKLNQMVYEDRWAMMMERPKGYVLPYDLETRDKLTYIVAVRDDVAAPPSQGFRDRERALALVRHMNGGWTFEEAQILQTSEPINVPGLAITLQTAPGKI